jgi:hypothetical protein
MLIGRIGQKGTARRLHGRRICRSSKGGRTKRNRCKSENESSCAKIFHGWSSKHGILVRYFSCGNGIMASIQRVAILAKLNQSLPIIA